MTQAQRDTISYGTIAVFSSALLLWIIPAWSPEYPGYGVPATLLPNVAAGFMLVLSLLGLVRTVLARKSTTGETVGRIHWKHIAVFLMPCVLLMPAMSLAGFIPAGIVFMACIQYACGQRRWLTMAIVAVVPVVVVYALMRFGLGVPMP